jgi:RNA polymerase sigma factor (sigma-70 family)
VDDQRADGRVDDAAESNRASREAFVRSTYVELYRWFHRLAGCPARAADLTQETFAAYWTSCARQPAEVSSRTWLYAIGRNLWRNQLRSRRNHEPLESDRAFSSDLAPERAVEAGEFEAAAREAVDRLPVDLRDAFVLRFWHEFSFAEIAAIQGVSADLARWRYFAARRKLHEYLAPWDPRPERAKQEDRHAR